MELLMGGVGWGPRRATAGRQGLPGGRKAFHVGMVTWSQGKRTPRSSEPPRASLLEEAS